MIFPVLLEDQKPNKKYLEELLTVLNLKNAGTILDSKNSQEVMEMLTKASRHYQQTIRRNYK